ncbi:hypothetical protein Avbf_07613, partial [Armadillidium vulgare]
MYQEGFNHKLSVEIRVQSLSCNLYANCDRCSSVGVVAISKIFGKGNIG